MKKWQKPITTRRYLHPPKSERLHTLWLEGKLVFGEVYAPKGLENYEDYISSGIWFTLGGEQLDFHSSTSEIRHDGAPVHTVINRKGVLEIGIEAFSSFERVPRCFIKLEITNTSSEPVSEEIGFVLRTAKESALVKDGPDIYRSYAPELSLWLKEKNTWSCSDSAFTDGKSTVRVNSPVALAFDCERGYASSPIALGGGETLTIELCYSEGGPLPFDYDSEREASVTEWNKEISKIKNIPETLKSDSDSVKMIRHLVAALLQNFNYPKDDDFLLARQGGLSRMIWPYESMPVLEALSRLGDFDDYIEPIIDMYFTKCQSEEGEIVPFGIHWAMCTANALYTFAKYSKIRGKEYFNKYRNRAYKAFKWIKETRASTVSEGNIMAGLFPPRRSCDDDLVFQGYGNTDSFNLRGLREISATFDYFSDPAASEISEEYNGYLGTMRDVWSDISKRSDTDELRIPFIPKGDDSEVEKLFIFGHFGAYLTEAIDIPESDAERVINYYTRRGFIRGGLYDRMPDKGGSASTTCNLDENGKCVVWYVTAHEYLWFLYFMRHGMKDRAKEIIDDAIRYAMTSEYYMIERYHENDPYFCPWSPNASANGRLLNMLLDYYG